MNKMKFQYLVLSDTNHVIDYLYSTGKYKLIRGASILLDVLNREETKKIADRHLGHVLTIGGGEARVLFRTAEDAEHYARELRQRYLEATDEVTLSIAIVKRNEGEELAQWFTRAESLLRLREVEEDKRQMDVRIFSPILQRCEICDKRPAEIEKDLSNNKKKICRSCYKKINKVDEVRNKIEKYSKDSTNIEENLGSGLMDIHKELIRQKVKVNGESWVNSIRELLGKEDSVTENYIGFVYADGRNIGNFFRQEILRSSFTYTNGEAPLDEEILEKYRKASEGLHNCTIQAAVDAAKAMENKNCPVDYANVGGDDFVAIMPAKYVVEYTVVMLRAFEKRTEEMMLSLKIEKKNKSANSSEEKERQNKKLMMSAGIVIAKSGYPINRLYQLSYELMSNAKKKDKENSVIDFLVLTDSTVQSVDNRRKQEELAGRRPRMNGYLLDGREMSIQKLLDVIRELDKNNFPRSKMKDVYEIVLEPDWSKQEFLWKLWRARLKAPITGIFDCWHADFKKTPYPFMNPKDKEDHNVYSPLLDLFDLYEHIERVGK